MAITIQTIEKGSMNWHIPMNANLEAIRQGFEQLDAQAGQHYVETSAAAFYALTTGQLKEMYKAGTRLIGAKNRTTTTFSPVTVFLLHEDGTASPIADHTVRNHTYEGKDLSTVFASAEAMHNAVSAGDFSRIETGDHWPVTLSGSYTDCGENATKSLKNAVVKFEVAGIDSYIHYGDKPLTVHHLVMIPRDCLPNTTKWRSADTTWYDTAATNPWLGSAIYATLNVGILPLIAKTDIGAYIYSGPNGKGMRFLGETKASGAANATSWGWLDRGKLFLPFEREIWGQDVWSEHNYGAGLANQLPVFSGSLRHIIKGLGDGGSRCAWWLASSAAGSAGTACYVTNTGSASISSASTALGLAPCFLFA